MIVANGSKLLVVALLVLLNAFFVAAELALVRIRETQLDELVAKGNKRAKIARHIVGRIDAYIGATQFGITMASLGLGVAVEPVFRDLLAPLFELAKIQSVETRRTIAICVGFFVNSYLLIVIGELAPKAYTIRKTLPTVLMIARPLNWFYHASFPFVWLLNHSALGLLRQLGIETASESELPHSDEELRLLLNTAQKQAGTSAFGRGIVLNALDLRHRIARDVMRPRQEITFFDMEAPIADCIELAEKTRYSRFPLCHAGDLDKTRGVVHIKDLYAARDKARRGADLIYLTRKLIYVPDTARLEKLLKLLIDRKLHMAIVVDEYGGTLGLVTLENILEEVVGQIQDEFDQETPQFISKGDGIWEASGTLPLHELEKIVEETLQDEDITTASGWITHRLGGFPKEGDTLTIGQYDLRVEEMDGPRVEKLKITRHALPVEPKHEA
ncbi:MAG TPA: hemolysin family protein [Verrucomicrobiae bacterium]|nr:hemolysin family protein [Verrucomicrobiae bacterium]